MLVEISVATAYTEVRHITLLYSTVGCTTTRYNTVLLLIELRKIVYFNVATIIRDMLQALFVVHFNIEMQIRNALYGRGARRDLGRHDHDHRIRKHLCDMFPA